jgi:hypothetical protein
MSHHLVLPLPICVHTCEPSAVASQALSRNFVGDELRFVGDLDDFLCAAMNELCAELDGVGESCIAEGKDAPADSIPSLENLRADSGALELAQRGKSGHSCTYDGYITLCVWVRT